MSNCEDIEIDELECETHETKEILKILLHSIIFQRSLGVHRLRDADSDLFDISYVKCDSHAIGQRVDSCADEFSTSFERGAAEAVAAAKKAAEKAAAAAAAAAATGTPGATPAAATVTSDPKEMPKLPARICVAFIERRQRGGGFGFFRGEEKVPWERWRISLSVRMPQSSESGPLKGVVTSSAAEVARRRQLLAEEIRQRLEVILTTAASKKEHIPPADGLGDSTNWFEVTNDSEGWGSSIKDLIKLGSSRFGFEVI